MPFPWFHPKKDRPQTPPPLTPAQEAAQLLAQAKLMVGYAARVGRLKTRTILAAIEKLAETSASSSQFSRAVSELTAEVNALAKAIAPVTLADLDPYWTPFPSHRHDTVTRPTLAAISTVLLVVLGYFTFIYSQASSVQDDLKDIQRQDIYSKAENLYNLSLQVKYLGIPPTPPQYPDSDAVKYFQEYDAVRRIQDQLFRSTSRADQLVAQSELSPIFLTVAKFVGPGARPDAGKDARPAEAPRDLTSAQLASQYNEDPAYNEVAQLPPTLPAAVADSAGGTKSYYNRMIDFLYQVGITSADTFTDSTVDGYLNRQISSLNNIVSIYGLWILPAFYALFGALLFQLRALMNPLVATPNLIVARGAMAMIAGVSISWIFASFSGRGAGAHAGDITVFGLAFLFGYSIDVFFSALDRLVASLSNMLVGQP